MRSTNWLLGLLAVFSLAVATPTQVILAGPSGTQRSDVVAKAVEGFEESRKKAQLELLQSFDVVANRLPQQGLPPAVQAELQKVIADEKDRFQKGGLMPWSQPMWPYVADFQKDMGIAEVRLRRVFGQEINRAVRANATDVVDLLRKELESVLKPQVVATWVHRPGGRPRRISFYSNGRIDAADGPATWAFHNGVLTMIWPDQRAPRGAWKDVCKVSADGSSYAGKNQHRNPIAGHYVAN
jgi:hypothetical protein